MHWSFPALSLLLLPLSHPIVPPTLPPSFEARGMGESASFSPKAQLFILQIRAEHRFRLRGAHWADFLLADLHAWPGPWGCRPRACHHVFHGRDSGGATMCWPLEEVPWHWNWDDYHQSRQVRTIPLISQIPKTRRTNLGAYFLFIYLW